MELARILSSDAVEAAPRLLGWRLCRQTPDGLIKLKIVETEAYHQDDPASHSSRGKTARTWPMFEAGGHLYVYFTYGMHYALNIVTGPEGVGEGVLIRAGQPLKGLEIMMANRGINDVKRLAKGPGCVAQALGIFDTSLSGKTLDLPSPRLRWAGKSGVWLERPETAIKPEDIVAAPRVGIKKAADRPWRFYIKDNIYVSKLYNMPKAR